MSTKCGSKLNTYSKSIGIGSNITAELCALQSAIETTLQSNLANFRRVFIFSDCQSAIDLSLKRCTPTYSFVLVSDIHSALQRLQAKISVTILYVPAHVGVPGTETAKAAQSAALAVASKSPTPAQPLIPLSTSNAFVRCALKARQQRSWFPIVQAKRGLDHLSRLRPCVFAASAFFVGTRRQQTILARLRFGTCNLNFSKSRLHANVNEECECGMRETVRHFLLECTLFESARSELVANVRTIRTMRDKVITEDVLLGGSGVSLSPEHWEVIVS